ncbi:SPOSA6832_04455, partial [Sporobolomyces salmonicolor]
LLSEFEAKQLIDHFHSTLNSFIILLDRHLHTLDFVRRTSTVLLTSMLAVSSKFFRPDLYPSLLMQAKQLTGRAIVEGVASLGLIQSILLLVYWKEPLDATSWFRIGMAIRLGLQLHLHAERTTPLPADAHEARLILDRERTWICLVCFDHYFLQVHDADDGFHQTFMIPQYRIRIEKWLEETAPYDTPDDLEQGAALEWVKVLRLAKDIARARPAHARALASHLNAMLEATYQRYLEASSPLNGKLNRQATVKVRYFLDAASVALNRSLLVAVGTNGVSLANFMVSASQLVDSVEALAREGMMRYVQDNLAVTMFGFAEFLAKSILHRQLFPRAYPANQATIISYVERGTLSLHRHRSFILFLTVFLLCTVYRACELAAEGKEDSTPAFVSRFYQTTLRVICTGPAPGLAPPIFPPAISSRAALPNPGARAGSSSGFPSLSPAPHPAASTAHFDSGFSFSDGIGGDSAYWWA